MLPFVVVVVSSSDDAPLLLSSLIRPRCGEQGERSRTHSVFCALKSLRSATKGALSADYVFTASLVHTIRSAAAWKGRRTKF